MSYKRVKPFTPTALTVSLGKQIKAIRKSLNLCPSFMAKSHNYANYKMQGLEEATNEITLNSAMTVIEELGKKSGKKYKVIIVEI